MNTILRLACVSGFAALQVAWGTTMIPAYSISPLTVFQGGATTPTAINSSGQVAGYATGITGSTQAFWSGGAPIAELGTSAQANGINDAGTVAGATYGANGARATVWQSGQGTGTDIGTLGGSSSYANAISKDGTVVGGASDASGQLHAFAYKDGVMTSLGNLSGSNWSSAYAVNNKGQVVGYALDSSGNAQAFMYSAASGVTSLASAAGSSTFATGINDNGAVVGDEITASGYIRAVAWASGAKTPLGTLGSGASFAYGVNNSGDAVGSAYQDGASSSSAVLFHDGSAVNLNTVVPFDSGWVLEQALAINDSGQIVGTGELNGQSAAFLLTPISDAATTTGSSQTQLAGILVQPKMEFMMMTDTPEPATCALTGLILLGLGCLRFRRQ